MSEYICCPVCIIFVLAIVLSLVLLVVPIDGAVAVIGFAEMEVGGLLVVMLSRTVLTVTDLQPDSEKSKMENWNRIRSKERRLCAD